MWLAEEDEKQTKKYEKNKETKKSYSKDWEEKNTTFWPHNRAKQFYKLYKFVIIHLL